MVWPKRNAEHAESQSTAEGLLRESIDDSPDSIDEPSEISFPFDPLPFSAVLRASAASAFRFSLTTVSWLRISVLRSLMSFRCGANAARSC